MKNEIFLFVLSLENPNFEKKINIFFDFLK
jgi:hypothetical protein